MKRSLLLCALLLILFIPEIKAQRGPDRFKATFNFSVGVLPIKLSGPMDVGDGDGNIISVLPVYRQVDTTSVVVSGIMYFGLKIPFYRSDSWSVGVNLNAGVGRHQGVIAADGLTAYVLDFPQYVYYRNYRTNFDYSFLLGYKYTRAPLPYHLVMAAFEYHLNEHHGFRFYGSLFRYKYYMLLSNGDLKPMVKIGEFGITYTYNFR